MATELIPERAQPLVICLDHGRLMGIGAGELTKLDHAINAALLLVHVALRSGDRAGMLAFSDTVTSTLPPRAGTAQLRRFLDATRPIVPGETEADYDDAFTFFSRWQTRRSLVVIFTDVLDPDQGKALIRQCVRLRRRHLPLVVTVRDPALDDAANAVREPATRPTRARSRAASSPTATTRCACSAARASRRSTPTRARCHRGSSTAISTSNGERASNAGRARQQALSALPAKFRPRRRVDQPSRTGRSPAVRGTPAR